MTHEGVTHRADARASITIVSQEVHKWWSRHVIVLWDNTVAIDNSQPPPQQMHKAPAAGEPWAAGEPETEVAGDGLGTFGAGEVGAAIAQLAAMGYSEHHSRSAVAAAAGWGGGKRSVRQVVLAAVEWLEENPELQLFPTEQKKTALGLPSVPGSGLPSVPRGRPLPSVPQCGAADGPELVSVATDGGGGAESDEGFVTPRSAPSPEDAGGRFEVCHLCR